MNRILFIISTIILINALPAREALCQEFEIKHADSLEATNQEIIISGNILIVYKDAIIEGPKATVSTTNNGNPDKATFIGRSSIKLNDRKLEADKITIHISEKIIIAEGNTKSELTDKNKNKINTSADYQEVKWDGENARAKGQITTTYQDTKINADEAEIIYKDKKPYKALFYGKYSQATLAQESHITKAKIFEFNIDTKDVLANNQVESTISTNIVNEKNGEKEQSKIFITCDKLLAMHESGKVTAEGNRNKIHLTYEDTNGESSIAYLIRDRNSKKPQQAIFIGDAYVSQQDKQLSSEEIIFNFDTKKLTSSITSNKRPKTTIFKQK